VFDRDEEARTLLREGMAARRGMAPLAAFQSLVRELLDSGHPLLRINPVQRPSGQPWPTVRCWWRTRDGCRHSWPTTWRS
jgi:hypothetical protein